MTRYSESAHVDPIPENTDPDLIIEGGVVLTMKEDDAAVFDAAVLIKGNQILDIVSTREMNFEKYRTCKKLDARNGIIMPGLVNAHSHMAMTLFRGISDDQPLKQWLYDKIFPLEAAFVNEENVYWGALLACLEMIASGTTCVLDGYFAQDGAIRAVHKAGMRGLISQGVIGFPAPGVPDPEKNIEVAVRFVEKWRGVSDLVQPGIFCHSPVTCSKKTLVQADEFSRSFQVPLQVHLSETESEVLEIKRKTGKRPVHYLDDLGLLSPNLIGAHGIHLDNGEIDRLSETGANLVHVPESNMKLGSGICRVHELLQKGILVGLGTDGSASNNNLDMFGEMDTAAKLGKVFSQDPSHLNARTVLKMATCNGAGLLGFEKEIGTLERGKKADIIVLDTDKPHLCPMYDPFSAIVYSAGGADVKHVIVNGKILMQDYQYQTLDADMIMKNVKKISRKISRHPSVALF